jgi:hypothetical protein
VTAPHCRLLRPRPEGRHRLCQQAPVDLLLPEEELCLQRGPATGVESEGTERTGQLVCGGSALGDGVGIHSGTQQIGRGRLEERNSVQVGLAMALPQHGQGRSEGSFFRGSGDGHGAVTDPRQGVAVAMFPDLEAAHFFDSLALRICTSWVCGRPVIGSDSLGSWGRQCDLCCRQVDIVGLALLDPSA